MRSTVPAATFRSPIAPPRSRSPGAVSRARLPRRSRAPPRVSAPPSSPAPRRAAIIIMPSPPRAAAPAGASPSSPGADSSSSSSSSSSEAARVAADTALLQSFAAVPAVADASLSRERDGSLTLRVVTAQRDLVADRVRRSVAAIPIPRRADTPPSEEASPEASSSPLPTTLRHPAFGVEERGVVLSSVSPSGARRLVVRAADADAGRADAVSLEVWEGGALLIEVLVPSATHGAVCADGTFGGVSWSAKEGRVAYVAEAPVSDALKTPEWGSGVTVASPAPSPLGNKGKKGAGGNKSGDDGDGAAADCSSSLRSADKVSSFGKKSWRGHGEWREGWGEQLVGRFEPALFVLEIDRGVARRVGGFPRDGSVAASGPAWAPPRDAGGESDHLVCPMWAGDIENFASTPRRLGLVFCFNRPSALWLARVPELATTTRSRDDDDDALSGDPLGAASPPPAVLLTPRTRSALWPRFSPDGKTLAFVSHERAVETGAHAASAALRTMPWSPECLIVDDENDARDAGAASSASPALSAAIANAREVVPVVDAPATRGAFPGLFAASPLVRDPWLNDAELAMQTTWGAGEAVVAVDAETGRVTRLTPPPAPGEGPWLGEGLARGGVARGKEDDDEARGFGGSWQLADVSRGVVCAIRSAPGSVPEARVAWLGDGRVVDARDFEGWVRVESEYGKRTNAAKNGEKTILAGAALEAIAGLEYEVRTVSRRTSASDDRDEAALAAANAPATVQSVVVRRRQKESTPHQGDDDPGEEGKAGKGTVPSPLIVLPHGGPHSCCPAAFVSSVAYLASLGYAVAYCNYRGSTGYGDAALQSLVGGQAGTQDVADCVAIADDAISAGIADANRVAVVGGSHGGFLGAHLIGQHPGRFRCAVLRNPVTDVASMVHVTDIPDWCFVETVGRDRYADPPSVDALEAMREASPIAHVDRVEAPVLMLLGAADLRVPPSNGLRYAAALNARGVDCRTRVFPEDAHGLVNPRTEFESFVTIAGFLREHVGGPGDEPDEGGGTSGE